MSINVTRLEAINCIVLIYTSCTVSMNLPPLKSNKACNSSLGMSLSTLAFPSVVKPEIFGGRGLVLCSFNNVDVKLRSAEMKRVLINQSTERQ